MKKFSMKFIDHFRHLGLYFLIVICIPLMVYCLFLFKKGYFDLRKGFLIGGIFFTIYSIPILLLHLNYYFNNHGDIFNYDSYSGKVIFEKKGKKIKFEKKDIFKITVFKSWPLSRNDLPVFPWDYYNYAVIELKNGEIIKLSSLLISELDKVIKIDNTEIKKRFYAWIV